MSPSFTLKNGVRYCFYVSSALLKARKAEAGSVRRLSASEIEAAVFKAIRAILVHETRFEVEMFSHRSRCCRFRRPKIAVPHLCDGRSAAMSEYRPQQLGTIL